MHELIAPAASGKITSADRLIRAVMELWHEVGGGGMSARHISQKAGIPTPSIYYHFGTLEQLYIVAQEAALGDASLWSNAQLSNLKNVAMNANAMPMLLAAIVDDWSQRQRQLAFIWREGQMCASRDDRFKPVVLQWRKFWSDFWLELCGHFGLEQFSVLTDRVFETESSLHMFHWRRIIDRAGLEEFCGGWTAWLSRSPTPNSPWRDFAKAESHKDLPQLPERDETALKIAAAAAEVVGRDGIQSLTHRAVAAEAGITLGVVSHKFRTSADLLHAAFETIYKNLMLAEERKYSDVPETNRDLAIQNLIEMVDTNAKRSDLGQLFAAVSRDPALQKFAGQLRYFRGKTTGRYLQAIVTSDRQLNSLDSALFGSFISGQVRAHASTSDSLRVVEVRKELDQILALLGS